MATQDLTPYQPAALELTMSRTPTVVLQEAEKAAQALVKLVDERQLFQQIGKRKHLYVEAWETIGHFYRVHVHIVEVRAIQIGQDHGFEAVANAVQVDTGIVLSSARSLCMTDEEAWRERQGKPVTHKDRYNMAQTRARSRAYRSVFDFVAVLAGYDPTPAEDMSGVEGSGKTPVQQPQRTSGAPVISEPQAKRLFAISKKAGWSDDELRALLKEFGYESSKDIERAKYDPICKRIEQGEKPIPKDATTQNAPSNESAKQEVCAWRQHFDEQQQKDIAAWMKGANGRHDDAAIDAFFRDRWTAEPIDALETAAVWLGNHPQGSLGV